MPKQKDIGLIFDVTLKNINTEKKELLDFHIRADGYCCVNISSHAMVGKMGRIVGGDFGFIQAGAIEKVSLIWPTVSLYNRVGVCHIIITSTNLQNEQVNLKQTIKFDTRFEMLDPDGRTLRKHKNFLDCKNWDKDYFENCTPVDCEERYFGLRNYYNETSKNCEEVPRCIHKHQRYNFYTNECIDTRNFFTKEDLRLVEEGKFHDKILELKPQKKEYLKVFANITIYILICFCIFLIVTWLSRRTTSQSTVRRVVTTPTSNSSDSNVTIYSASSLMSQR